MDNIHSKKGKYLVLCRFDYARDVTVWRKIRE